MRGCLTFVVFVALLIAAFTWFLLPPLAGWAVEVLLPRDAISGGVRARVETDFPPELYTLQADAVVLTGRQVGLAGGLLDAETLTITLRTVRLLDRTARTIEGRLTDVRINQGPVTLIGVRRIDLAGPSDEVVATITIDGEQARARAGAAIESALGRPPESLRLLAPDRVSATIDGTPVSGRLQVRDGALILVGDGPLPTVEVVPASATGPLRLGSLRFAGGDIIVIGTLDASALGLAAP